MKTERLAEFIGNIDDSLILEAQEGKTMKTKNITARRWIAAAAVVALMAASMAVGALALQPDAKTVYVSALEQSIELPEGGIALVLPDSWEGRYRAEANDNGGVTVYCSSAEQAFPGAGVLFRVERIEGTLPVDYVYPMAGYTIASTGEYTYALLMASDMQCPPDNEAVCADYNELFGSISQIKILLSDWMRQGSLNAENWQKDTVTVQRLNSEWQVTESFTCDEQGSAAVGEIIGELGFEAGDESFPADLIIMLNSEEYFLNSKTGQVINAATTRGSDRLSASQLERLLEAIGL